MFVPVDVVIPSILILLGESGSTTLIFVIWSALTSFKSVPKAFLTPSINAASSPGIQPFKFVVFFVAFKRLFASNFAADVKSDFLNSQHSCEHLNFYFAQFRPVFC